MKFREGNYVEWWNGRASNQEIARGYILDLAAAPFIFIKIKFECEMRRKGKRETIFLHQSLIRRVRIIGGKEAKPMIRTRFVWRILDRYGRLCEEFLTRREALDELRYFRKTFEYQVYRLAKYKPPCSWRGFRAVPLS